MSLQQHGYEQSVAGSRPTMTPRQSCASGTASTLRVRVHVNGWKRSRDHRRRCQYVCRVGPPGGRATVSGRAQSPPCRQSASPVGGSTACVAGHAACL
ncbi:hypothetical protein BC831DRAFT_448660 [Entophlyctis helioformis]|nr:hypothetical protein BC831DRAFT_448660 [Entophlyctis helioformis]